MCTSMKSFKYTLYLLMFGCVFLPFLPEFYTGFTFYALVTLLPWFSFVYGTTLVGRKYIVPRVNFLMALVAAILGSVYLCAMLVWVDAFQRRSFGETEALLWIGGLLLSSVIAIHPLLIPLRRKVISMSN